jgi:aerobic carbon-monoxide dehydrogenase medium subunit
MFPAKIDSLSRPKTVAEAAALIASADEGNVLPIGGGMSLMQAIKARVVRPGAIVDLNDIGDLKGIKETASSVWIGAMTRYVELATSDVLKSGAFGALSDAASHVGDRQVRNRGTIGGSLCWNYVAACVPVATLALGAELELVSKSASGGDETRVVSIDDFIVGPMETSRHPQEILRSVTLTGPRKHVGSAYRKWGHVTDALPVVGIGVRVVLNDDRTCNAARVAIGGLSHGSQRFYEAERRLLGTSSNNQAAISDGFRSAAQTLEIQSDTWASADYRKVLIEELGTSVVLSAMARAEEAAR